MLSNSGSLSSGSLKLDFISSTADSGTNFPAKFHSFALIFFLWLYSTQIFCMIVNFQMIIILKNSRKQKSEIIFKYICIHFRTFTQNNTGQPSLLTTIYTCYTYHLLQSASQISGPVQNHLAVLSLHVGKIH